MRHGIFELVDVPDHQTADTVVEVIDSVGFPWHRLQEAAAADPDGAVIVKFDPQFRTDVSAQFDAGLRIVIGTGRPDWRQHLSANLAHELGHLVDVVTFDHARRMELLDLMHASPETHRDGVQVPHTERHRPTSWGTGPSYWLLPKESYAELFLHAFAPDLARPVAYTHWTSDLESVRRITLRPEEPVGYYLIDNPNPHAFGGFHGYTTRQSDVRLLVIHTTENRFDTVPPDTGAEAVANYLSNTSRAASYHDIADSDSIVKCLPHSYTAFGARGHNSHAIHMAFAGQAARWDTLSDGQVDKRLKMLAGRAREACATYGIPVRRLFGAAAREPGARGICGHSDLDPGRRSDPGSGFPWGRFLTLLEDDMALSEAEQETVRDIHRVLKDYDSSPMFVKHMIMHLRNHPTGTGGGLSEADVRRIATEVVRQIELP